MHPSMQCPEAVRAYIASNTICNVHIHSKHSLHCSGTLCAPLHASYTYPSCTVNVLSMHRAHTRLHCSRISPYTGAASNHKCLCQPWCTWTRISCLTPPRTSPIFFTTLSFLPEGFHSFLPEGFQSFLPEGFTHPITLLLSLVFEALELLLALLSFLQVLSTPARCSGHASRHKVPGTLHAPRSLHAFHTIFPCTRPCIPPNLSCIFQKHSTSILASSISHPHPPHKAITMSSPSAPPYTSFSPQPTHDLPPSL